MRAVSNSRLSTSVEIIAAMLLSACGSSDGEVDEKSGNLITPGGDGDAEGTDENASDGSDVGGLAGDWDGDSDGSFFEEAVAVIDHACTVKPPGR